MYVRPQILNFLIMIRMSTRLVRVWCSSTIPIVGCMGGRGWVVWECSIVRIDPQAIQI